MTSFRIAFFALIYYSALSAKAAAVLVADGVAGLDGNWTVHTLSRPSESKAELAHLHCKPASVNATSIADPLYCPADATLLRDLAMDRMLLYPPNSSMAFIPAAFLPSVQPGSSFSMTNCTITTLCNTLAAYRNAFMGAISATIPAVGHMHACMSVCVVADK